MKTTAKNPAGGGLPTKDEKAIALDLDQELIRLRALTDLLQDLRAMLAPTSTSS